MADFPADIYTEPSEIDPDTMKNLGPLAPLAGVWEGKRGLDVNPKAEGPEKDAYYERYELQPIDPQANGPQLLYGLRYHTHILRPNKPETFHDQVGYWLWEPATGAVILTLTIPRGQIAMATGKAAPDARRFEAHCEFGSPTNGTCSIAFLDHAFRTLSYHVAVTVNGDGTWSYEQDTVLKIAGSDELFHHTGPQHAAQGRRADAELADAEGLERQALLAHRPAPGERDLVEGEMELGLGFERHAERRL
jgi:hypothetical protein